MWLAPIVTQNFLGSRHSLNSKHGWISGLPEIKSKGRGQACSEQLSFISS
jgi:hypothetical protein